MEKLTENNIEIDGDIITKEELIDLYRLQKQLLIEENIVANIPECLTIWCGYSADLSASWLYFPQRDEEILSYIKTNSYFISFENYLL